MIRPNRARIRANIEAQTGRPIPAPWWARPSSRARSTWTGAVSSLSAILGAVVGAVAL